MHRLRAAPRATKPLALFVSLLCLAGLLSSACGGGGGAGPQLVVIDQNVLHGFLNEDPAAEPNDRIEERIHLLADGLAQAHPDIIMLQEVLTQSEADYPKIRDILMDALGPEYTAVFGNIQGDPIDTPGLGQMTITRLPIVSSENHHIGGVRGVHRVTVRTDDGPLDLYNVHLEGTDETDPQFSVDEITKVMNFIEDTRSGGPVILAGDFNAHPDSPSIRTLLEAGFVDVLDKAGNATCKKKGDPGCTNSTVPLGDNPGNNADQRIDYIFVLAGDDVSLRLDDAQLFLGAPIDIGGGHTLWASDHIGVRGVLELKR